MVHADYDILWKTKCNSRLLNVYSPILLLARTSSEWPILFFRVVMKKAIGQVASTENSLRILS